MGVENGDISAAARQKDEIRRRETSNVGGQNENNGAKMAAIRRMAKYQASWQSGNRRENNNQRKQASNEIMAK